jgi:hypothetical protein
MLCEYDILEKNIMKPVDLIIRIDGKEIDKGLDLFEFVPSILALGTVIKEASKVFELKKEIGINIKPIEKGSFLIELALFSQNNLNEILSLIQNNDVKDIKELLEWIGLIKGGVVGVTGISLFKLIKYLSNKPIEKREVLEPGKIKYSVENGEQIIVNGIVDKLYNNSIIHQHFYTAFRPLEKEGVEVFESYLKEDPSEKQQLVPEDIAYIKSYSDSELRTFEENGRESTYETSLNFKRGSYEGESNQWSFRKGDQVIVAVIRDEVFLQRIKNGEVRPYTKDFLRVELREMPKMIGTEIKSVSYEILEVKEYKQYEERRLF